ncbi:MAG: CDP-diacylglycerol--glycerol-3-phosphate 3-phosphatidyltransferase [Candidatus Pacebacteria bacterium]|nr:CDP-diacylglycerol--glycerol-3-phosphate 3-phosphatidyltransferase [Candidatus Paceibacterota bacterium]
MRETIPNVLTIVRILLTMVAIALVPLAPLNLYEWLFALFALAAITDFADGYLARRWEVISDFGKIFDPLADKVLTFVFLVMLYGSGIIPAVVILLLIVRDLVIDSVRGVFAAQGLVVQAITTAKVKTALIFVLILLALAALSFGKGTFLETLVLPVALLSLAFSYISAAQYARLFWAHYHNPNTVERASSST